MADTPPVWQMIKEAIEALGGRANNKQLIDYAQARYPSAKQSSLSTHISICTVNSPSRVHDLRNNSPRIANGHLDFLFRTGRGTLERYDPLRHGVWEIRRHRSGRLYVGQVGVDAPETAGLGVGGRADRDLNGEMPPASPRPLSAFRPKRFYGAVKLNPLRLGSAAADIGDAVVQHLMGLVDSQAEVILEVRVLAPKGIPEDVERAVSESAQRLLFQTFEFEEE